jgi:hypothetical protein
MIIFDLNTRSISEQKRSRTSPENNRANMSWN